MIMMMMMTTIINKSEKSHVNVIRQQQKDTATPRRKSKS